MTVCNPRSRVLDHPQFADTGRGFDRRQLPLHQQTGEKTEGPCHWQARDRHREDRQRLACPCSKPSNELADQNDKDDHAELEGTDSRDAP